MFKFSLITKEGEWDYENPTLEEMRASYEKLLELINAKKRLKVTYGYDTEGKVIKAVVVSDPKENECAVDYTKFECERYEPVHPLSNVKKLLENLKNIIETVEERGMEQKMETMVEVETKVAEVVEEVRVEELVGEVVSNENADSGETMEDKGKSVAGDEMDSVIPGIDILDKSTAEIATDSLWGHKLHIRALLSKETNRRKYLIFEVNRCGEELGTISCDALFRASEVRTGSSKVKNLINDLDGQYDGQMADILRKIAMIERKRVLIPDDTLDIDACKTFEEFWRRLQKWFGEHLDDVRVGITNIKGKTHVALVKRDRKGINDVFRSVIKEISPDLKSSWIKSELYRRGLLYHDVNDECNDSQLTVGWFIRQELGILNDKIMSFAFDEEVIERMKEGYDILHDDFEEEE